VWRKRLCKLRCKHFNHKHQDTSARNQRHSCTEYRLFSFARTINYKHFIWAKLKYMYTNKQWNTPKFLISPVFSYTDRSLKASLRLNIRPLHWFSDLEIEEERTKLAKCRGKYVSSHRRLFDHLLTAHNIIFLLHFGRSTLWPLLPTENISLASFPRSWFPCVTSFEILQSRHPSVIDPQTADSFMVCNQFERSFSPE